MHWAILIFERVVELVVASLFTVGSILLGRFATDVDYKAYIDWLGDHLEVSVPLFLALLLAYLIVFGLIVRYFGFLSRGERKYCGLYAQIFYGRHDELIIAPFLVLYDILKNELAVTGYAFSINPESDGLVSLVANWNSAAALIDHSSSVAKMTYLYSGRHVVDVEDIKGVTTLGLALHKTSSPKVHAGYICDLEIPSGNLGLIRDVGQSITAFRIVTARFDGKRFREFVGQVRRKRRRILISLFKINCDVPDFIFERFLKEIGIQFLVKADLKGASSWRLARRTIAEAAAKSSQMRQGLPAVNVTHKPRGSQKQRIASRRRRVRSA